MTTDYELLSVFLGATLNVVIWLVIFGGVGRLCGLARGRPGAGVWMGVLLGPIGWLFVLIGPDHRRKCRDCGGALNPGASKCCHCGTDLTAGAGHGPGRIVVRRRHARAVFRPPAGATPCPLCRGLMATNTLSPGVNRCPVCDGAFTVEA